MSDLLAEGLLRAFDKLSHRLRPATGSFLEWLREISKPPPGVELRAADGTLYTGVVVVDRSKVVVMLAIAAGQTASTSSPIPLGPAPSHQVPSHQFSGGSSSYGTSRRLFEDEDPGDGWPPNDPFLHHHR